MTSLIAFMDILGTKQLVRTNQFDDLISLDFVNPVGIAAKSYPNIRCSVFSDSVILSANEEHADDFLESMSFINAQWRADFIFSRGGISIGDITWVDHSIDTFLRNSDNFSFGRVYGQALIEAIEVESKSGPGAVNFLTREASKFFRDFKANCVLESATDVLQLFDEHGTKWVSNAHGQFLTETAERHPEAAIRQHYASKWYLDQMLKNGIFLPDDYSKLAYSHF